MLGNSPHERADRDFYPSIDEDMTRVLIDALFDQNYASPQDIVWECACGSGEMMRVLEQSFLRVFGTDIVPLIDDATQLDFLTERTTKKFDVMVTNPPYGDLLTPFMERGLDYIRRGKCKTVAMLARHAVDTSGKERTHLFQNCPEFAAKVTLTWRPRWIAGSTGSPRHNYSWFIWSQRNIVAKQGGPRLLYAGR